MDVGLLLGTNISAVSVLNDVGGIEDENQWCESTSELLSKCYPDLSIQPRLSIKTLIGQKFSDLKLHSSDYLIGSQLVEGHDGFPVFLDSNHRSITIPQLLSKYLLHLWENFVSRYKIRDDEYVSHCYIGTPIYFTSLQRRILENASCHAGLDNITTIHETTAAAAACRYLNKIGTEEVYVVVDMGVVGMQVCVAKYMEKGTEERSCILSHAFDNSLGGRAFDMLLLNHFVDKFNDEHGIDVRSDPDLYWNLYSFCEKMKIELTSHEDASFEVSWGNKELIGFIKRDEFEGMCATLLERVTVPLEKALEEAGLCVEKINSVQCVGLASQIPAITKKLTDFFRREPNQVQEGETDLVAIGCSLLSSIVMIYDNLVPHSIMMSWDKNEVTIEGGPVIFLKGSKDYKKEVSFSGSATFYLDFMHDNITDPRIPNRVERCGIKPCSSTTENVQGKLIIFLICGIVSVQTWPIESISETGRNIDLVASRVTELRVIDPLPYSIVMSWDKNEVTIKGEGVIFPKGSIDGKKLVLFYASATFFLEFIYDSIGDPRIPTRIERFKIIPSEHFESIQDEEYPMHLLVSLENGIAEIDENIWLTIDGETHLVSIGVLRVAELEHQKIMDELHAEKKKSRKLLKEFSQYELGLEKIIEMYSKPEFYDCEDDDEYHPTDKTA